MMLLGCNVFENAMIGTGPAVLFDCGLVVSPALASLLRSETGEALRRLAESIKFIDLRESSQRGFGG